MNAAVAQERWQGQVIDGRYPLREWIGGSAHSAVFRTELPSVQLQPTAIKLIPADGMNAAQQIARWKESAALAHSNLLRIFDAGHCQIMGAHWLYIVMEFAEENLDQVLPVRPLTSTEVSELLPPVLEALAFLHAKGLVHGRIKPSNVLAVKNQLKLSTDSIQPKGPILRAQQLSAYDAPEAESAGFTTGADVWSLGMTLVTAFNQRPLTWSRSSHLDPEAPKSVPALYRQVARECLRISPEQRCSLSRIKDLVRQEAPVAKPVAPAKPKPKMLVPVLAGLALLALIFGLLLRHSSEKQLAQMSPAQEQSARADSQAGGDSGNSKALESSHSAAGADSAGGVVKQVLPPVPLSARQTITGKVKVNVRVAVNPDGNVSSANLSSAGPSKYFARLALEASRNWKFKPAVANGQAAATQWLLEYKFGRAGTEVHPIKQR